MSEEHIAYYQSDIGLIKVRGTDNGISFLGFVNEDVKEFPKIHTSLKDCVDQLNEYFSGTRKEFSIKLDPQGTPFQRQVWSQLTKIPYGETASYKNVAEAIGNINAVRAVGNANGCNDIVIIVPCHRVIGSDGTLVGFGSGLDKKQWLLDHESRYIKD